MRLKTTLLAAGLGVAMIAGFSSMAAAQSARDFSGGITGLGERPAAVDSDKAARDAVNQAVRAQANQAIATDGRLATTGATDISAYRLGPGDKVRVTVFNEPDLSGEFEVDSTGILALPLAGDVKAGNLPLRELEQAITRKLDSGYLVNPRVSVEVLNFRPFFILGEVNKPGSYPYVNGLTAINAVAVAGGYTPRAKTGTVYVKRNGSNGKEDKVPEDAQINPGDVIRVDERFF